MNLDRRYGFYLMVLCTSLSLVFTGCAGKKKKEADRLAALQGEDIPLSSLGFEDWQFVEADDPIVFNDILFDYNSSIIKRDSRAQLEKIAEWLQDRKHVALMVEGHCDERGSKEYNLALGEQRALSVRRYLVALGVEADRVYTVSYGEEKPLSQKHKKSGWAKNRRSHFLITQ